MATDYDDDLTDSLPAVPDKGDKRIDRNMRIRNALEYRKSGASYEFIAQRCGWKSAATARKAVKEALENLQVESTEEARTLMIQRLEHLMVVLYPKANKGDLGAVDRFLALQERLAKLQGLDKEPEDKGNEHAGVIVIDANASEEEYLAALEQLPGPSGPAVASLNAARRKRKIKKLELAAGGE